jgi:hypothetical protein
VKHLLALALLLAPASSLARSGPTISGLRTPGYCASMGRAGVALCALQGPTALAMPVILAGGFTFPGSGIGQTWESNGIVLDSATAPAGTNAYVNYDGTNVGLNAPTGKGFAFSVNGSSKVTITSGGAIDAHLGNADIIVSNASGLASASDGGNVIRVGGGTSGNVYTADRNDAAGAIAHTFGNDVTLSNATAKLVSVQNNATEKFAVYKSGEIVPGADISGASKIAWVGRNTYTIDFGAFAGGGASQNSAQAMTGLAFGDGCTVGADGDTSAEFAAAFVEVTSAGNFKLVILPLTAAGTVNPASHTYTVTCIRSS